MADKAARYDEEFKKSLVAFTQQRYKVQSALCKEYGISQSTLAKWIKQYSTVKTEDGEILTAKQIKVLQKRNALLEEENVILKKAIAHLHATLSERLAAVYKLRLQHNIRILCRVLQVNRSTYYKHFFSSPAPRNKENQVIRSYYCTFTLTTTKDLAPIRLLTYCKRDYGIHISVDRVYRY